jgi:hypothetical protein
VRSGWPVIQGRQVAPPPFKPGMPAASADCSAGSIGPPPHTDRMPSSLCLVCTPSLHLPCLLQGGAALSHPGHTTSTAACAHWAWVSCPLPLPASSCQLAAALTGAAQCKECFALPAPVMSPRAVAAAAPLLLLLLTRPSLLPAGGAFTWSLEDSAKYQERLRLPAYSLEKTLARM